LRATGASQALLSLLLPLEEEEEEEAAARLPRCSFRPGLPPRATRRAGAEAAELDEDELEPDPLLLALSLPLPELLPLSLDDARRLRLPPLARLLAVRRPVVDRPMTRGAGVGTSCVNWMGASRSFASSSCSSCCDAVTPASAYASPPPPAEPAEDDAAPAPEFTERLGAYWPGTAWKGSPHALPPVLSA
jgi:hypothetical protein